MSTMRFSVCWLDPGDEWNAPQIGRDSAWDYYGQCTFNTLDAAIEHAVEWMESNPDDPETELVWIEARELPEWGPLP